MSFLNPLMLLALAAASIPLLLHLLNLRKGRTVPFSTVRFLHDLQQSRLRALRIRQILLLLLRLGTVVLAVLAFAGPVIGSSGSTGVRSVVIIVDNTWSTGVGRDERPWIEPARIVLGELGPGDSYTIVPLSDPGYPDTDRLRREREWGERFLDSIQIGYATPGYSASLEVAGRILQGAEGRLEVLLLTDRQRINLDERKEVSFPAGTRIELIDLESASEPTTSISVDSVRPTPSTTGTRYSVTAAIRNRGEETVSGLVVALQPAVGAGDRARIDLAPGESREVTLRGELPEGGTTSGVVTVSGDMTPEDNRRWYTIVLPESLPVSVIANGESRRTLQRVFGLVPSLRPRDLNQFRESDRLKIGGQVIVAVDPGDLGESALRAIGRHVRDGGGLFLVGGPALADEAERRRLIETLGISLGAPVASGEVSEPYHVTDVAASHPLFEGVFDREGRGRPPSPSVRRLLPSVSGEPLITLDNGSVLLSDIAVGAGRVLYLGVPLDGTWSDIRESSLLVPILLRGIEYLSTGGSSVRMYRVGDDPVIWIDQKVDADVIRVYRPDGSVRELSPFVGNRGLSITPGRLSVPGEWIVVAGIDTLVRFSVNGDPRESISDVEKIDDVITAIEEMSGETVEVVPGSAGPERSGGGPGLWQYLLMAAVFCAFAELVVGRKAGDDA